MTGKRGSTTKDLGRRAFGTVGGWEPPRGDPGRIGEVIGLAEESLCESIVPRVPSAWKPRAGRIYNFPVRTVVVEK